MSDDISLEWEARFYVKSYELDRIIVANKIIICVNFQILKFQVFQVCFATCFDPNILSDIQANNGKLLRLKPTSADVVYR